MVVNYPFKDIKDDGLETPEVGVWAKEKYTLLFHYANQFATSMKNKWDQRVYIDPYASSGMARVRETGEILFSSSLLALKVDNPFDKYIFCENNSDKLYSLEKRANDLIIESDITYICGDTNEVIGQIINAVPIPSKRNRVIGFCFLDPYRIRELEFSTIQALAKIYLDFLILIPTGMDAGRNISKYLDPKNTLIDNFVGTSGWREAWLGAEKNNTKFELFLTGYFSERMKEIGYTYGGLEDSYLVRSDEKNLPLYRLGFFSRHQLGGKFWRNAKRSSTRQQSLFKGSD